jgi:hypothetical protein
MEFLLNFAHQAREAHGERKKLTYAPLQEGYNHSLVTRVR